MAQNAVVMAFRKRLKNRGYRDICITRCDNGNYLVQALEPLAGFAVQVEMEVLDMFTAMR